MINKLRIQLIHMTHFYSSYLSPSRFTLITAFSNRTKQPKSQAFTPPPPLKQQTLKITTHNHHHHHIKDMEVEVKFRLPDSLSHQKLSGFLSPFHIKTHLQENIFFDGANSVLTSNLAVLRLRFYDLDSQCIVSLKAKPVISSGISQVEEDEEPIDPSIGRACVSEPWRLFSVNSSRIVKRVGEEFGIGEKGLVCLGGFKNVRAVHHWNGLKLELDEIHYDFGTSYELECESLEPEKTKKLLEELLKENGIACSYSEVSKFAIFQSRKLPY